MSKRLDLFEQIERQAKKSQQIKSIETYYAQHTQWDKRPIFALSIASGLLMSFSLASFLPKSQLKTQTLSLSEQISQTEQFVQASNDMTQIASLKLKKIDENTQEQLLDSEKKTTDPLLKQSEQSKSFKRLLEPKALSEDSVHPDNYQMNIEHILYPEKGQSSFSMTNNHQFIEQLRTLYLYYQQGNKDLYDALLDQLLLESPAHKSLLPLLAKRYQDEGNIEKYHQVMKNLVIKYAQKRDIDNYTKSLMKTHDYQRLREVLLYLPEPLRQQNSYQEILAYCYMQLEQHHEASSIYQKLTEQNPYQAAYWLGQAKALEALDERKKAFDSYQQALNLGPDLPIRKLAVAGVIRLKSHEYSELQQSKNR